MQADISLTGGARVGFFNATWPFARLEASPEEIRMNVTFMGTYVFPVEKVIAVHKFVHIPFLGWGIRIEHMVKTYPAHMVFWYFGYPATVTAFLEARGFPTEKLRKG